MKFVGKNNHPEDGDVVIVAMVRNGNLEPVEKYLYLYGKLVLLRNDGTEVRWPGAVYEADVIFSRDKGRWFLSVGPVSSS